MPFILLDNTVDKRTVGYKRCQLSMEKGTVAMLELLKAAKATAIPAKYVLFDSWFTSPSTLHAVKEIGYDVIGMVKKTPKIFFHYNNEDLSLVSIYKKNKKRRGRSKYLLSVLVEVVKNDKIIPAKVVYVRNRNKKKEYLCLISTDTSLSEEEIIRIYGKRWDINHSRELPHQYDGYNILDLDDDNHLFGRYFNNRDNSNVGNKGGNIGTFELQKAN